MMNLSENRSINQNAIANIVGLVVLNGVNFFTMPLYTNLLGAENYGVVSIYNAWVMLIAVIVGLQLHGAIGQAKLRFTSEQYPGYLSSSLGLSTLSFVVILAATIIFVEPIAYLMKLSSALVILMVINAFGSFCLSFTTTYFTFAKQPFKTMALSLVSVLVSLGLSVMFIFSAQSEAGKATGAIIGKAIPTIIFGFVFLFLFLMKGKILYSKDYARFTLPLCLPIIFHALSQMILGQCDKIMLQPVVSAAEVGVYSFFVTFSHLINAIWNAFNNTWVPFYYDDVKNGAHALIKAKTKNYIYFFTTVTLGFMLLAPEVAKWFSTEEFWGGVKLIPIMCVSMYFIFLYSFAVNFELYHCKTKTVALGTVGAALLNIVFNFIMIKLWGIYGAAIATLISYVALFVFHHTMAKHIGQGEYHYSYKTFAGGILAIAIGVVLFYTLIDLWYIRWGIGAILGVLLAVKTIKQKSIF